MTEFMGVLVVAAFYGASPIPWGQTYALQFQVNDSGYKTIGWCSEQRCVLAGEAVIHLNFAKGTVLCWRAVPRLGSVAQLKTD